MTVSFIILIIGAVGYLCTTRIDSGFVGPAIYLASLACVVVGLLGIGFSGLLWMFT